MGMNAGRFGRDVQVATPGHIEPGAAHLVRRWVAPVVRRCFRPTLEGRSHLPAEGPYLLVANHSAGVGLAELLSLAALWVGEAGEIRPLAGFAHPIGFRIRLGRALHRRLGSVPSTYAAGREALARGVPLLVFPGGDHESLKPVWHNGQVDFGGRRGFLRLAREAGVPVVPLGIRDGALTAPMLLRARWLAWALVLPRAFGLKRWGVSLLGALGAAALWWGLPAAAPWRLLWIGLWLGSPLSFLPIFPATLRLCIGPPLSPEALFPTGDGEPELQSALVQVQAAVQALVRPPAANAEGRP